MFSIASLKFEQRERIHKMLLRINPLRYTYECDVPEGKQNKTFPNNIIFIFTVDGDCNAREVYCSGK